MIRFVSIIAVLFLTACQSSPRNTAGNFPQRVQGQYVRPAYLNPAPVPRIPAVDACRSQLYQGLVGQSEGAIYIAGLPGAKRVIKPGDSEGFGYEETETLGRSPTFMEVRDYLPGQMLYAPSIRTPGSLLAAQDFTTDRITIELDIEGYVQEVRCG